MKTFKQFINEASNSDRLRRLAAAKQNRDIYGNRPTDVSLDVLKNLERNASERNHNRYPEQSKLGEPHPIRSRPTQPNRFPLTKTFSSDRNPEKPLTPQEREKRRLNAGAAGRGTTTPSGSKLYRQNISGTSTGDDPIEVLISAGKQGRTPRPPKPKKPKGGSSRRRSTGR